VHNIRKELPAEFAGYYDSEKYKKSQLYLKDNTYFSLANDTFFLLVTVIFILSGGFNYADKFARSFGFGTVLTGLIFTAILIYAFHILKIPFSAYRTFVIEEKYGFNKTSVKTFVLDIIKSWVLLAVIGGILLSGVLFFFIKAGSYAWIYCWLGVSLFQIFIIFIAPIVIMPLFNKFVPLEEGELKNSLEKYAQKENFKMKGLYKMDGSKRSSKSNAFFTGFGKYRRIVLFDTLIEKHTTDELVSVLAHEMGHYKMKHILKSILLSLFTTGIMFYILSLFINSSGLFEAFKMEHISVYAGIVFFGFLYTPINMLFSVIIAIISRKHEYEADDYAARTFGKAGAFIEALKKLSVANLSNLTPHPLKVFLEYSHPPVLERIRAIRNKYKV
jgi:STE24 endopeptidase